MTLTEFLLARIAEDEAAASLLPDPGDARGVLMIVLADGESRPILTGTRAFAEVTAKRAIVQNETERQREQWQRRTDEHRKTFDQWQAEWPSGILRDLAAVYSDHPDYDEAWRT